MARSLFAKGMNIPKSIRRQTYRDMKRYHLSLYDAFNDAVRDHYEEADDELQSAFMHSNYRWYIPSEYITETVYGFVRHCMDDREFNAGGIPTNERRFLDAIGFPYAVKDGNVEEAGEDLTAFYEAMATIRRLHYKYKKGD